MVWQKTKKINIAHTPSGPERVEITYMSGVINNYGSYLSFVFLKMELLRRYAVISCDTAELERYLE